MANGIRTGNPRGFNKGRSSKFREGSRVQQTSEEGWRTYRLKCCGNNNKDEDNSPKILNDENIYNIHNSVIKRKNTQMCPTDKTIYIYIYIYIYCSMNKQYVEGVQKWKKAYLMNMAM